MNTELQQIKNNAKKTDLVINAVDAIQSALFKLHDSEIEVVFEPHSICVRHDGRVYCITRKGEITIN